MRNTIILPVVFLLLLFGCTDDNQPVIDDAAVLEAGSVDELADKIDEVEEGETIILAKGDHFLSEGILINKPVCIVGAEGARLIIDCKPLSDEQLAQGGKIEVGLYVEDAPGFCIKNVELLPVDDVMGGTAIFLQNSPYSLVEDCKFTDFQFGILLDKSDETEILGNDIEASDLWQTDGSYPAYGLVVITGHDYIIKDNLFTKGFFGAWICDSGADQGGSTFENNEASDNHIGVIPCAVPDSSIATSRVNNFFYTMQPGKDWTISNNHIHNNDWFGILLFDGSEENTVSNNNCYNNGSAFGDDGVDIEIGGSSFAFNFPTSTTKNNLVNSENYPDVKIRNCGASSNEIVGGDEVIGGPCF